MRRRFLPCYHCFRSCRTRFHAQNMVQCAAFRCNHNSGNAGVEGSGRVLSFHSFPIKRPLLLKKWLVNIRRAKYTPTTYSRLCSAHFTADAFEQDLYGRYVGRSPGKVARRRLKADAFPTEFAFTATVETDDAGDVVEQRQSQAALAGAPTVPTGSGSGTGRKPRLTSIARRRKRDHEEQLEEVCNIYLT